MLRFLVWVAILVVTWWVDRKTWVLFWLHWDDVVIFKISLLRCLHSIRSSTLLEKTLITMCVKENDRWPCSIKANIFLNFTHFHIWVLLHRNSLNESYRWYLFETITFLRVFFVNLACLRGTLEVNGHFFVHFRDAWLLRIHIIMVSTAHKIESAWFLIFKSSIFNNFFKTSNFLFRQLPFLHNSIFVKSVILSKILILMGLV